MYIKNHLKEKKIFSTRMLIASIIMFSSVFAVLINLFYLQIVKHKLYYDASTNNRILLHPITPTRGKIYDRNSILLTTTKSIYSLKITNKRIPKLNEVLTNIATLLKLSRVEISKIKAKIKKSSFNHSKSITIVSYLSDKEVAILGANIHKIPGSFITATSVRYYPYKEISSHALGYVSLISKEDLNNIKDKKNYKGQQYIGKTGVEKTYEHILYGKIGTQETEINAKGKLKRLLKKDNAIPGNDINIHLDIKLQQLAYNLLANKRGAIVGIEPKTGGILTLVNKPSYDPNLFVASNSNDEINAIMQDKNHPLFNRSIRGKYPPASTIKPFLAIAALDSKVIKANYKIYDKGWYKIDENHTRIYHDWKKNGHGIVDLNKAIFASCDTYFYKLSIKLGINRMHDYLSKFNFGSKVSLDLFGENSGILPNNTWKQKKYYTSWTTGDSINMSIGQGFFVVSPIQLAAAVAIIANKGQVIKPRMLKSINNQDFPWRDEKTKIDIEFDNWQFIIDSMRDVMHKKGGTGFATGSGAKYTIAGKTGTAQVFSFEQKDGEIVDTVDTDKKHLSHLKDHSIFIGFAPINEPKIAIAIIIENGGDGSTLATPIAKKIFDQYLLPPNDKA